MKIITIIKCAIIIVLIKKGVNFAFSIVAIKNLKPVTIVKITPYIMNGELKNKIFNACHVCQKL